MSNVRKCPLCSLSLTFKEWELGRLKTYFGATWHSHLEFIQGRANAISLTYSDLLPWRRGERTNSFTKFVNFTNLFHHSLLVPTWTAFSDHAGPDLLCSTVFIFSYYATAPLGGGIKRWYCLTADCLTSVAYIGPKSRKERHRETKIDTEVVHVTRDSDTTFKIKRSKVNLQGRGHIVAASRRACFSVFFYIGSCCRLSWLNCHRPNAC